MRGQPPYGRGPGGYNRDPYPPPPPPSYMRDRMDGYVSFEVQIITLGDKIRKKIAIFFGFLAHCDVNYLFYRK